MRVTAIGLALILGVQAAAVDATVYTDSSCKEMGLLAQSVMVIRQANGPLIDTIEKLTATTDDLNAKAVIKQIVLEAYSYPAYNSENFKNKASKEFKNDVELRCLTGKF